MSVACYLYDILCTETHSDESTVSFDSDGFRLIYRMPTGTVRVKIRFDHVAEFYNEAGSLIGEYAEHKRSLTDCL